MLLLEGKYKIRSSIVAEVFHNTQIYFYINGNNLSIDAIVIHITTKTFLQLYLAVTIINKNSDENIHRTGIPII